MIFFGNDGCGRVVHPDFRRRLDEFNHAKSDRFRIHLFWNPTGKWIQHQSYMPDGRMRRPIYEPRWEVWVEWDEANTQSVSAEQFSKLRTLPNGSYAVRLMPYETAKGEYADPFGEWFFRLMHAADSWAGRRKSGKWGHYEDLFGTESEAIAAENKKLGAPIEAAMRGIWEYYDRLDTPVVGHYTKGNWRKA